MKDQRITCQLILELSWNLRLLSVCCSQASKHLSKLHSTALQLSSSFDCTNSHFFLVKNHSGLLEGTCAEEVPVIKR